MLQKASYTGIAASLIRGLTLHVVAHIPVVEDEPLERLDSETEGTMGN